MIKYLEEYLTKRNPLLVAIFLFILAFILRFYMVFVNEVIVHDGILYINMAKIIDSGNLEKISEDPWVEWNMKRDSLMIK